MKNKIGLILGIFLMMSIGTAALFQYYGNKTGTLGVTQGVTVDGDTEYVFSGAISGNTYCDEPFTVKNIAGSVASITLDTRCNNTDGYDDGTQTNMSIDWSGVGNNRCDGITTYFLGSLNLTKKDTSTWQATGEPITITYTLVGDEFVINEAPPTNYVFVYAMDKSNRFQNYATVIRVENIDESLPYDGDWNAEACPDYCDNNNGYDDYAHCVGAKIWAVPETAIGACVNKVCTLTWTGMADYYYETDLITYTESAGNEIDLPANGGGVDVMVCNELDIALATDTYTVKTDISPV